MANQNEFPQEPKKLGKENVGSRTIPDRLEPIYIKRGSAGYRRSSAALFLSAFATFALLYCTQLIMPLLASEYGVSPASSSVALSFSSGFLAFSIFAAAVVSERFSRRGLMFGSLVGACLCNLA